MKTQQKTIYMPLLIIGLISIISLISCKKRVEYISYFDYKYVNNSSETLYIKAFRPIETYCHCIMSGKTLVISTSSDNGFLDDMALNLCDSAVISYKDTTIQWTTDMDSDRNPLLHKNYETYHTGTRRTEHIFIFKDEDFR